MGRILQLDSHIANGIAAGEVVERPASVVKELIENSIDAGATSITVEIQNGGITLIRIIDDGCGMDEADAQKAFDLHSTSKIKQLEDLFDLNTMGFRGEALASIAAAAKINLKTKQPGNDWGTEVILEAGQIISVESVSCNVGTKIEVRDLFYNFPARYKFLKKDRTETMYITSLIQKLALVRPDIAFLFINDGKEIFHTPGDNQLSSPMFSIYGSNVMNQTLETNASFDKIIIKGFIGKPELIRNNRSDQIIFVNERLIKSKIISAAIDKAYQTYLMRGKYPFCILLLSVPTGEVDVNVHPQKQEVRFANEGEIFRSVYHIIQNQLASSVHVVQPGFSTPAPVFSSPSQPENKSSPPMQKNANPEALSSIEELSPMATTSSNKTSTNRSDNRSETKKPTLLDIAIDQTNYLPNNDALFLNKNQLSMGETKVNYSPAASQETRVSESINSLENPNLSSNTDSSKHTNLSEITIPPKDIEQAESPYLFTIHHLLEAKIIGVAFLTYILMEYQHQFILLDQHGAHEKILFEQLMKKYQAEKDLKIPSEQLLFPQIIFLTPSEMIRYKTIKTHLSKIGFIIEEIGAEEIALRGIPAVNHIITLSPEQGFREAFDSLQSDLPHSNEALILRLATSACKAAVKAHDRLSDMEIRALLQELTYLKDPYHCPHGRPIFVIWNKKELEKQFKRLV